MSFLKFFVTIALTILQCRILWTSQAFILRSSRLQTTAISKMQLKNSQTCDYHTLKSLQDRCKRLTSQESQFMLSFWSESLKCFQIYPNLSTHRISVTTTCISLNTILDNPEHWFKIVAWEHPSSQKEGMINLKDVVSALYGSTWTGDPFQTSLLLSTLCKLNALTPNDPRFQHSLEISLEQRAKLSLHRNQLTSSYLRFHNSLALLSVVENDIIPPEIRGTNKIGYALERSNMVAFDELCRQIAFHNCGDSANFDVIILVFSLLTYYKTSQSLFLQSFARGVIQTTNVKLLQSALEIIFQSQLPDGTWRKGEPVVSKGVTNDSRSGRDIGNSYVFFLDMIAMLVEALQPEYPHLLASYVPNLEKCVLWAESNILEEMMPEECDPVTRRCFGPVVRGWRSNHLGTGGAVGWCTANTFSAIHRIDELLQTLITSSILCEFRGSQSLAQPNTRQWESLMDAELSIAGQQTLLKHELFHRLIKPQFDKQNRIHTQFRPRGSEIHTTTYDKESRSPFTNVSSQMSENNTTNPVSNFKTFQPSYSCILFGPPGTAKTTLCTSIAAYLGWNFVTIDTACFLANGLQNVAARMTYIFERLRGLDNTIILFDEVEEFCLDRENPNLGMESRMLTTAMLTQLNDLRRQQSVIFIVATNRLRSFDAAVTRPGRFDLVLFVGTPDRASRLKRLESKFKTTRVLESVIHKCLSTIENFMLRNWTDLRFLTFAENEAFSTAIIDFVTETNELSEVELTRIMNIIQKTATIRGAILEDYLLSEALSRA